MRTRKRSSGRGWATPLTQIGQIAWAAPQVVGYRAARIARGSWSPSARDRRENTRMIREKVETLGQVAAAVTTAPRGSGAAERVARALAPVHRRVLANRRRLSRG